MNQSLQELRALLEPEATLRLVAQALLDQEKPSRIAALERRIYPKIEARFKAFHLAQKEAGLGYPKELLKVYPKTEVSWALKYLFSETGMGLQTHSDPNGGILLLPKSAVALSKSLEALKDGDIAKTRENPETENP